MGNHRSTYSWGFIASALLFLGLSACRSSTLKLNGHYEGTLLRQQEGGITQEPVSFEATVSSQGQSQIQAQVQGGVTLSEIKITLMPHRTQGVVLSISGGLPGFSVASTLLRPSGDCFLGHEQNDIRFCIFNEDKFLLEFSDVNHRTVFALTADRFSREAHPVMEPASTYSILQMVRQAQKMNFNTRIEYERLLQAKNAASLAYLNLLPQLSISIAFTSLTSGWGATLGAIGDLAPFLFPTRWFQVKEVKIKAKVEADTLILMRADLATQIEGFGYALLRDQAFVALYSEWIQRLDVVCEIMQQYESSGQLPSGASDALVSLRHSWALDRETLASLVVQERAALAEMLGFHNPQAIADVLLDDVNLLVKEIPIERAIPIQFFSLHDTVLARSFELRQLDHLLEIARLEKQASYFNWLDPHGGSLFETVSVGSSSIKELKLVREQLKGKLTEKFFATVSDYNLSLDRFRSLTADLDFQEQRLQRLLHRLNAMPGSISAEVLVAAFQDHWVSRLRLESTRANYRVARSKIDRLLLQGYYVDHLKQEQLMTEHQVQFYW